MITAKQAKKFMNIMGMTTSHAESLVRTEQFEFQNFLAFKYGVPAHHFAEFLSVSGVHEAAEAYVLDVIAGGTGSAEPEETNEVAVSTEEVADDTPVDEVVAEEDGEPEVTEPAKPAEVMPELDFLSTREGEAQEPAEEEPAEAPAEVMPELSAKE